MSLLSIIRSSADELVDFARRNIDERGMRIEADGDDAVKLVDKDRGVVLAKFNSVDDMIESYGPRIPDLNYGNADNYIQAINPTGSKVEDMINLNMGDMYGMLPRGATKIKSEGGVNYYKDGNDFYATTYNPDVGEEDVIGYHLSKDGSSELQVVNEMKGKGIGAELSYQFRKNNPEAPSGGLSEAGERTARKTYDRLKAEGIVGGTAALGLLAASPESEAGAATQFIRLLEAGYPESTARKIMSGELPMDEASRMDRAMDQGFDVDTRYYHGTDQNILEFDPELIGKGKGKTPSALPQGFYFSRKPDVASEYATGEGANVIPVFLKTEDMMTRTDLKAFQDFNAGQGDSLLSASGDVMIIRNPEQIRSFSAAFDPDEIDNPNIMASPAPVGAVGGLLASEAATPEGQLNPLLAVPAEIGSALNEALVGTVDFLVPDTVNAVSSLLGSEYRMPRLSDQELVRLYSQGGYMDEGYGRDAIRAATGLLSPL